MILPISAGDVIDNDRLTEIFKCAPQGGMRRSKGTGTLVLVTNDVKSIYSDEWQDDILMYTGMGTEGDQSLEFHQNRTLAESDRNGVELHLFTVKKPREYTYVGRVELAGPPEQGTQPDKHGAMRRVWRFPLRICQGETIAQETYDQNQINTARVAGKLSIERLRERIAALPQEPRQIIIKSRTAERSPYVAEYAKRVAEGVCQLCGRPAPFSDAEGNPYLESHHIQWISEGGPDTIRNIIALCPNCHRKMHIINDEKDVAMLREKATSAADAN